MREVHWDRVRGILHSPAKYVVSRYIDIDGLGNKEVVSFEVEVWKLRGSETVVTARIGNEELQRSSTYNDFYGFLTSSDDEMLSLFSSWVKKFSQSPDIVIELKIKVADDPCVVMDMEVDGKTTMQTPTPWDWMLLGSSMKDRDKKTMREILQEAGRFNESVIFDGPLLSSLLDAESPEAIIDKACTNLTLSDDQIERIEKFKCKLLSVHEELVSSGTIANR